MIATEASVVNLENGFAALQALLAPLSLPPPAVTHYVNRLVSPAPSLRPLACALRLRHACALRTVFKPWLASLGHGHRYASGG